jgi:hypothetical protein
VIHGLASATRNSLPGIAAVVDLAPGEDVIATLRCNVLDCQSGRWLGRLAPVDDQIA